MQEYITMALQLTATIYGTETNGRLMCGDVGRPVACDEFAVTASGEPFDRAIPTAAVPMPANRIMRPYELWLTTESACCCVLVRINDKANPRFQGVRGLDLSPAVLVAMGIQPTATWSSKIQECIPDAN